MFLSPNSRLTGGVAARRAFPAGTQLTFINPVAPIGWTRVTTFDDAALRIVGSAAPSSGGSNGFSTVMAQTAVGNTTLSTAQLASHPHAINSGFVTAGVANAVPNAGFASLDSSSQNQSLGGQLSTNNAGSGSSHNHTITLSMNYVDALVARKS